MHVNRQIKYTRKFSLDLVRDFDKRIFMINQFDYKLSGETATLCPGIENMEANKTSLVTGIAEKGPVVDQL